VAPPAFVIDCDGTLVDTERLWTIAKRATTEHFGATWSESLRGTLTGTALETCAQVIAEQAGRPREAPAVAAYLTSALSEILESQPVNAHEGAAELLLALAERGIAVAVASNGRPVDVEIALDRSGLAGLVAAVRCPGPGLSPKPEPDLYLAACGDLGREPEWSVAIEDAPTGVLAARRAGLLTLGLTSPGAGALDADLAIDSLWPLDIDALVAMLPWRRGS
jgi:HAD superfamily hydrolase (TIGR01509 family)